MPTTFTRTIRSLNVKGFKRPLLLLFISAVLIISWCLWFFLAKLTLYEISEVARIEVDGSSYTIQSEVSGKVLKSNLTLGQFVEKDQILAILDTKEQDLKLEKIESNLNSIIAQLEVFNKELDLKEKALFQNEKARENALEEVRLQKKVAEIEAVFAKEEKEQFTKLKNKKAIAEVDFKKATTVAEVQQKNVGALKSAVSRIEWENKRDLNEGKVAVERLKREIAILDGEASLLSSTLKEVNQAIDKHSIKASVSGKIGERIKLSPGQMLNVGDVLASIIPDGKLKIQSYFRPEFSLGRIKANQFAEMRIDGFPWTQYGSLTAKVTNVAGEVRNGLIQVELSVLNLSKSEIPVQHGMPGLVEVEVEKISPVNLLFRIAGKFATVGQNKKNQLPNDN